MPNADFPWYLAVIIFAAFFALVWMFAGAFLAELSGWRLLLRRFAAGDRQVSGKKIGFVSALIHRFWWGKGSYKGCLTVYVNKEGFLLQVFLLLRFCSPALFIPWESVEDLEITSGGFTGRRTTVIIFDSPVRLTFFGAAGEAIEKAFQEFRDNASL